MPLAHNLNKVTKSLAKSKGTIHIKGRKFKQLNRATLRDKKITTKKMKSLEQKESNMAVIFFLQKLITEDEDFKTYETFELKDMKAFLAMFVERYDDELNTLREERRPGRPQTARQQKLEEAVKHERHLYDTGIKIPDLTKKDTVKFLRAWNGSTGGTTIMNFVHVYKDMQALPTKEEVMTEA